MMDAADFLRAEDNAVSRPPAIEGEPWDAGEDDAPIRPRGWLLGTQFCREFISGVASQGGTARPH